MHSERDWLVKRVFPALRERLELHRIHLVDIDLRWGITDEQANNDKVLDLCLDQIDGCRPFFLGLLGERYGWVPSKLPDESSKNGWTQLHTGKSVTELEIRWGVMMKQEMRSHALSLFRDPAFLRDLPCQTALYDCAEFPTADERQSLSRQDARANALDRRRKLKALKDEIRSADIPYSVVEDYTCRYHGLKINWRLERFDLGDEVATDLEGIPDDRLIDNDEYAGSPLPASRVNVRRRRWRFNLV